MSDTQLRSGWGGVLTGEKPLNPAESRDWEAGAIAAEEAKRIYLEVLGPRLEREQQADADTAAARPTSRFL